MQGIKFVIELEKRYPMGVAPRGGLPHLKREGEGRMGEDLLKGHGEESKG